ncbi:thiamine phosphate synthase [Nocardioides zeae]|uniref:Thiamine phosphate synthase n=1 Tax=Nocardioides imazamoxiresistens TaxID=3231893 RepID=A0ABU3PZ51_9ACTN|nr:thiamine phosphate synthase [Nocardioides zeae]MDT9594451.1 thiamine phosphate synthase [Nocardioides zeae]
MSSGPDGSPVPSTDVVLLTDRSQLRPGRDLVRTVRACVVAGLRTVVVRELDLSDVDRTALVARLLETPGRADPGRAAPALHVLSARTLLPGAHGVHLAAHQSVPDGGGPHGRSCHDPAEVRAAVAAGAAYVTLSPFAATASKPGHGPPLPPQAYAGAARACAGSPTRVLALGGVEPGSAAAAVRAGADGVAVMGAVMRAADPAATVRALLRAVEGAR